MIEYREIPGWPGYFVGDDGSVWCERQKGPGGKRVPRRRVKLTRFENGYMMVKLCAIQNGKGRTIQASVHRLVLLAFRGPCPEGMEACHFPDRDKENNRLTNLRWDTKKANSADSVLHGTARYGSKVHNAKLTEEKVRDVLLRLRFGESPLALAKEYGVSDGTIHFIKNGTTWRHVSL
jgi:hypothetical protein